MIKRLLFLTAILLLSASSAMADAGALEATNAPQGLRADALKLRKMVLHITVEDQHAFVSVLQLFENVTDADLEGKYVFRIPEGAAITDFAIWEDGVRIPGVIMERQKASRIYGELTASKIDPGLLEHEEGEEERNAFVARVYPIPHHGVKRIELFYEQPVEVTSLQSQFVFPLKPELYESQSAADFEIKFTLSSAVPLENFELSMGSAAFKTGQGDDGVHKIIREFNARDLSFADDIAFTWKLKVPERQLDFLTYRDVHRQALDISPDGGRTYHDDTGYFLGRVTFGTERSSGDSAPRDIIFALDTSLSMHGRKLEAAFEALSDFMGRLKPQDRFSVILFNDEVSIFEKRPVEASRAQVDRALSFIREQTLTGGTDLMGCLAKAVQVLGKPEKERPRLVVLITDGNPTADAIAYKKIEEQWKKANEGARLFIFGIGNNANAELLEPLAKDSDGYFIWAEETEDLDFKLRTFFEKVGAQSIGNIRFQTTATDADNFTQVYPADPQKTFAGGAIEYVGKYLKPGNGFEIGVAGDGVRITRRVDLPEEEKSRPWIRRAWAKARVAYLLRLIRFQGEREEWVAEIIALAKEFKFVTPYTSFLAAPRALLRPRIIKPGDPILRVRTDPSIRSVTAIFPFGLIKPMRLVEHDAAGGDVWEARFLAPKWMSDGVYNCTLILFDDAGHGYRENKEFIIDSRPPRLNVTVPPEGVTAGSALEIKVDADPDTRWIRASMGGLDPIELRWNPDLKISKGILPIPAGFAPGPRELTITAEDFAHNTSSRKITVTVRGGAQ